MSRHWPRVGLNPDLQARIRSQAADFVVREELGFEPSGDGEHVYLHLEKCGLNTLDLVERLSQLSGLPPRDIGYSGLKDRRAITSQWFSLGMAGRECPDWRQLDATPGLRVLGSTRHLRKLKRGVHRANRFSLLLRDLRGKRRDFEAQLTRLQAQGVPNYFGEQRFGRDGNTLAQAQHWQARGGRRVSRQRRSLYLSALRAQVFNTLLAQRVTEGCWNQVLAGDVCMLQGSRSLFACADPDADIERRADEGDIHPGLPLWGRGASLQSPAMTARQRELLSDQSGACDFLERAGLELAYRPSRLIPDDFCWQFCDDASLRLEFSLGTGCYATAVLAELVQYEEGGEGSGDGGE